MFLYHMANKQAHTDHCLTNKMYVADQTNLEIHTAQLRCGLDGNGVFQQPLHSFSWTL